MDDDVKLSLKIDEVLHVEQTPFQKLEMFRNETFGVFMFSTDIPR
jgi:spermidine synthase